MAVEIAVSYLGDLKCQATHGPSGETLVTEAAVEAGGTGRHFSPTDLVATALATCMATILGMMAQRHGVETKGMRVQVAHEMLTASTRRIGSLRTRVTIPADQVAEPGLRQRLEAAVRACPVHRSLHAEIDAPIDFCYN